MGGSSDDIAQQRSSGVPGGVLAVVFFASSLACSSSKQTPAPANAASAPAGAVTAPQPTSRLIGRAEAKSHCEKMDPPVLISRREATYPDEVRRQRIEGSVVVQGTVSTEGVLGEIKVLESSDSRLTDLALDAFRVWRYKPALCAGEPIEAYVTATFSFKLDR